MRALFLVVALLLGAAPAHAEPLAPIAVPGSDLALMRMVTAELTGSGLATFGVAVRHLPTGRTALVNPDLVFDAASLFKLAVLYEAHHQMARGRLSLDEKVTLEPEHFDPELGDSAVAPGDEVTVDEALELIITV